ncbi:zinc finger HIT domain-containing protein 2 [Nelusetta ayraudi]|uniref:zinc finger HIT domain-containing protein 2 n=1 Tax=Nelusetta ayraudi TaxID=303726 RepID=UPI003F72CCDC
MNPVIRRRLPPSLRTLLTDIGPKEEWTDTVPDATTRDGILLPPREGSARPEECLVPAEVGDKDEGVGQNRSAVCMLCKSKPSCYTCPQCNVQYCSLACYRCPEHSVCSEKFYKEAVLEDLKSMGTTENEAKQKMQEVLLRLRQQAESTDGGMESLLKDAGVVSNETEGSDVDAAEKVQIMELLSRLAELQQSGEGSATEIEAILRKLEELGGEPELEDVDEDGQGVEEDLELADRLSGLDIDKLSEEELWGILSSKEKETFMGLVKRGDLAELVPLWTPWWEEHAEGGKALVEVLEERLSRADEGTSSATNVKKEQKNKSKGGSAASSVPRVSAKIPKLSSLCANPSPLVCFGLVNALYAYAFTLRLINNDADSLMMEFCDMMIFLSEALNSGRVFNSIQDALDSGRALIVNGGYLDKEDPLAPDRALEAVAHITAGRDEKDSTGYCLAALSQLRSVLSEARRALSKDGEEGERRQKYFLANKKCEFFQAWTLENEHRVRVLALELWKEHSRRESERSSMDKDKGVVKENLKKRKSKRNVKIIEEVS